MVRKPITYSGRVSGEGYQFGIETKVTHFEWDGSGRMDEMPGDFLTQEIYFYGMDEELQDDPLTDEITRCLNRLAVELEISTLWKSPNKREITSEPNGYAKLVHDTLINEVQRNPQKYIGMIRPAVKKAL